MAKNQHRSKWLGRLARYGPLVLWIGVIFYFSSSFGSFNQTSRFIRPLLEFLFPAASPELLSVYHGYIRKFAHFAEYAALALFAVLAFSNSSLPFSKKYSFRAAFCTVLIVAVIDEINQSFWVSRSGSAYDVILDVFGGLAALSILYLISGWGWKRKR